MSGSGKPGSLGCLVSIVLLAGGIAVGVLGGMGLYKSFGNMVEYRFVAPGEFTCRLEPGKYTLWQEYESELDGKVYSSPPGLGGMLVRVLPEGGDSEIPQKSPGMNETYNFGARRGVSVRKFTIKDAGPYVINSEYPAGVDGPEMVLGIGQGGVVGGLVGICLGLPLAGAMLLAALIVGIVSLVRRSSARKAAIPPVVPPAM